MFITTYERHSIETTFEAMLEAFALTWTAAKPYLMTVARWAWLTVVYTSASAFALGMLARDGWEALGRYVERCQDQPEIPDPTVLAERADSNYYPAQSAFPSSGPEQVPHLSR